MNKAILGGAMAIGILTGACSGGGEKDASPETTISSPTSPTTIPESTSTTVDQACVEWANELGIQAYSARVLLDWSGVEARYDDIESLSCAEDSLYWKDVEAYNADPATVQEFENILDRRYDLDEADIDGKVAISREALLQLSNRNAVRPVPEITQQYIRERAEGFLLLDAQKLAVEGRFNDALDIVNSFDEESFWTRENARSALVTALVDDALYKHNDIGGARLFISLLDPEDQVSLNDKVDYKVISDIQTAVFNKDFARAEELLKLVDDVGTFDQVYGRDQIDYGHRQAATLAAQNGNSEAAHLHVLSMDNLGTWKADEAGKMIARFLDSAK